MGNRVKLSSGALRIQDIPKNHRMLGRFLSSMRQRCELNLELLAFIIQKAIPEYTVTTLLHSHLYPFEHGLHFQYAKEGKEPYYGILKAYFHVLQGYGHEDEIRRGLVALEIPLLGLLD